MNEKKYILLNYIKNYYHKNHSMPTINYLKNIMNYKSSTAIYKKLKSLEKEELLINKNNKWFLNEVIDLEFRKVKVINKDEYIYVNDNYKNYLVYQIKDNSLLKYDIKKNDILIFAKMNKCLDNDICLVQIKNTYNIYKYNYENGFISLNDGMYYVDSINIVGKLIEIRRKIKREKI